MLLGYIIVTLGIMYLIFDLIMDIKAAKQTNTLSVTRLLLSSIKAKF